MFDIVKVARVSARITEKTIEQWNEEFSSVILSGRVSNYEQVAQRLVNEISLGNWKYLPYVSQELVAAKPARGPVDPRIVANVVYVTDEETDE